MVHVLSGVSSQTHFILWTSQSRLVNVKLFNFLIFPASTFLPFLVTQSTHGIPCPLFYTLSPYLTLDTFDDVRGVDGSRGAQSLEDGEAQSLMQVGSRGAESTEDGTESLVHDKGAESLEDGVDIMPQRIKSAQLKLREELKMFSDDTYLCNDLETLTRSTEVLINLRKTFVTQCRRENGLMLNNQKEIVMVRKDSEVLRALPANKRRVAKTKKRKWNQGMLFFCWLYFVKMLTLSHWSSCPLLPLLSVTGRT